MTRRELSKSRVIVTGASGGIGRELALQLAAGGARVCFTARREERLIEMRSSMPESAAYVAGDITDANVQRQIIGACESQFGGVDVLVNNAGVGAIGPFAEADPVRLRTLFEVNFFAAAELTRLAIPLLREGNNAAIVNIGSVLSHFAVPKKSEYCASKFALRGFSDSLRAELRAENIDVLSVHPNTTQSEFFERLVEQKGEVATNPMQMSAEKVAGKIISAINRGRAETVLSRSGKCATLLNRLFPSIMRKVIQHFG
ncbi:SDR family NAD(P)-dependent oxidoreductase [Planctomycetota bacterium]